MIYHSNQKLQRERERYFGTRKKLKVMITNFETHTKRLSAEDMKLVDFVKSVLQHTVKQYPITGPDLLRSSQELKEFYDRKNKIRPEDIRRCINYLRRMGILAVISTAKGYYSTTNSHEIQKTIQSLEERSMAIQQAANGLKHISSKMIQASL